MHVFTQVWLCSASVHSTVQRSAPATTGGDWLADWLVALINCSVTGSLIINNKHNYYSNNYYRPKEMLNLCLLKLIAIRWWGRAGGNGSSLFHCPNCHPVKLENILNVILTVDM